MKKISTNKIILFSLLFFVMITATIFQSIYQDYTSIIDFDLTVIHNSLQLVSNKYPDFDDLTAYSHFLTYGLFYKAFSFFDHNLITNINLLVELKNPELILQKLYIISKVANSIIHFITIVFIYKLLGIFKIDEYYKTLTIFFIIFSETFLANFIILRTDIVAVCYFFISAYYLLDFIRSQRFLNLFLVSFFMILSLLAKVQIIFLFMFLFYFFIFYIVYEKKNENLKNSFLILKTKEINLKYILLLFILLYFLFQIYLNNFVNSSTGVGYFDLFCFGAYFIIMYFTIFYIHKVKKYSNKYLCNIFSIIIAFSLLNVFLLKLLNIFNIIKIDFNIIFSLTNPFYFLKIYSPFLDSELSKNLIYEMFVILFKDFNFNIIYSLLLLFVLTISVLKIILYYKEKKINQNYIYILLLALIILFLSAINNFRYNVSYNIYFVPFFFILLGIFHNSIQKKFRIIFSIIVLIFIVFNFLANLNGYQKYVYKPSNLHFVCLNKSTRHFYYNWARKFDEDFFRKICFNKNLLFK
tara:strand:+ start:1857 stop:3431 length:1575 start_codon:yes stop_codon:yes gene_type:complete